MPVTHVKGAVSAGLECVRTLTQARKSVYIYAWSKQTVNYNFRPGIGQKEVFASPVAFSRHLCRVVWCVWMLITTVRWNNNEFMTRKVTEYGFEVSPLVALIVQEPHSVTVRVINSLLFQRTVVISIQTHQTTLHRCLLKATALAKTSFWPIPGRKL